MELNIYTINQTRIFLNIKIIKRFIEFTDEYDLNYDLNNKNIPNEIYQRFAKIIFKVNKKFFLKQNKI